MKFHVRTLQGPSTEVGNLRLLVELATSSDGSLAVARDGDAGLALVRLHRDGALPAARGVQKAVEAYRSDRELDDLNVAALRRAECRGAQLILVSDWFEGIPLALLTRLVTSRRLQVDEAVVARIMLDAARGAEALLEGDALDPGSLTPEAIWLGTDGRARVVEGPVQHLLTALPATRRRLERHAYRSPEQLEGAPSEASAQFSIATMAWELLAKRRRFAGLSRAAIDEAIEQATWTPPPKADGALVDALETAMKRDPAARFASLGAMGKAIEDVASSSSPLAHLVRSYLDKHPALPTDEHRARAPITPPRVEPRPGPRRSTTKPSMRADDLKPLPSANKPLVRVVEAEVGSEPPRRPGDPAPALPGLSTAPTTIEPADSSRLDRISVPASSPADDEPPSSRMVQDTRPPADSILPPSSPDAPDDRRHVGRCELFAELAKGGMARVHLGRWLGAGGFSKIVAVKALHNHYSSNPEFVRMFLDEARVVARVRHPNVMPIVDLVEDRGELFIVMEYHPGVTLAHLLRQMKRNETKVPIGVALRIMSGVLHGLQAANEATDEQGRPMHIVHRDVSPENILVGTDGYARVIDFGIATALGRSSTTKEGQIKGKPSYLSPEQIVDDQEVDHRADIYSASVVLWQSLTGRRLIRGRNLGAVTYQILEGKHRPPSRYRRRVSTNIDRIVLRGLEREARERWAEAATMAEALESAGPLATHREVGAWVGEAAEFRLGRAAKVVAAVERAPVEHAENELVSPMSIHPAAINAIPAELRELDLDRSQDIGPDVEPPTQREGAPEEPAMERHRATAPQPASPFPSSPEPAPTDTTPAPSFVRHGLVALAVALVVTVVFVLTR